MAESRHFYIFCPLRKLFRLPAMTKPVTNSPLTTTLNILAQSVLTTSIVNDAQKVDEFRRQELQVSQERRLQVVQEL